MLVLHALFNLELDSITESISKIFLHSDFILPAVNAGFSSSEFIETSTERIVNEGSALLQSSIPYIPQVAPVSHCLMLVALNLCTSLHSP